MKIRPEVYESMKADIAVVAKEFGVDVSKADSAIMWRMLSEVSYCRAYDDSHPAFAAGRKRVLPYDGREYCFYYAGGCNDTHVSTALRNIQKELSNA